MIPATLTGDNRDLVFHTIINRSDTPASNHPALDKNLRVPDTPGNFNDHLPDQPSRALDVLAF